MRSPRRRQPRRQRNCATACVQRCCAGAQRETRPEATMTREPNAIDFWRGFALITIFIDHIPGLIYERYTLVNYSISDAADLFVFLAGWSLRLMADGGGRRMPTRHVILRLLARALELYAAQVLITMLAIAVL